MKPLLLLFLLPCLAKADLQSDIDSCIALHIPWAPGNIVIDKPLVFKPLPGDDNFSLVIRGNGHPQQWSYYGQGFPFEMDCPKGVTVENFNGWAHAGGGYHVTSHGSAGRFYASNSRVQSKHEAWLFEAIGGADISCVTFTGCDIEGASTGWRFVGPNNLNPTFTNCTGSNCQSLWDFTSGGSDHVIVGGGSSHCGTAINCNPGYQGSAQGITCEDTGTVLDLGSGTGSGYSLSCSDIRGCETLVRSGQNGASTRLTVQCLKVSPNTAINLTGDSGKGYCTLIGAATQCKVTAPKFGHIEKTGANVFKATGG